MSADSLLSPAQVERIIREGLLIAERAGVCVESIAPQQARIRLTFHPWMLRPDAAAMAADNSQRHC